VVAASRFSSTSASSNRILDGVHDLVRDIKNDRPHEIRSQLASGSHARRHLENAPPEYLERGASSSSVTC